MPMTANIKPSSSWVFKSETKHTQGWNAHNLIFLGIFYKVAKRTTAGVPGKLQCAVEMIVEFYIVMYVLIAVSYYFLSIAAKKISIGVAYAVWEGLGISLITVVSIVLFDSDLNSQELLGLMLAVIGIVCAMLTPPSIR